MEDDTTAKKHKGQKIIIISVVLVVLVGAFLLNLFFSQNKKQKSQEQKPESIHLVPTPSSKETKVPGQLVVKFKKGVTDAQINSILSVSGATIKSSISGINALVLEVPKGQEDVILQKLKAESLVDYSEPDYIQKINFVPNDPNFVDQWSLKNTGQPIGTGARRGITGVDIDSETAWDTTQGGVKIAIIDTGVDTTHPDLAGKIVAQKIFVTSSIDDKYGHGTHVAGIIAANTNNGVGIAGVCPSCQLMIVKAMDDQGLGDTSTLATAITWSADNGAKVINLSEGGAQKSQAQADAIAYAWSKGAVVVAAAGNDNSVAPFYPAALTLSGGNVISVAATDSSDARAPFSNFGTWVSVAAPGVNILSTLPTYNFGMQQESSLSLRYDYLSGTSMAAPIVSGIAGLVWSTQYGTTNASVRDRILNNVDKISGTGDLWVYGRVNAAMAVGQAPVVVTATVVPTSSVTEPVGATISPATPITPTIFCLGAVDCGATTPTTAPDGGTGTDVTIEPGGETLTTIPGDGGTIDTTTPTVDPCSTTESTVSVQHRHHHHHRRHSFDWFLKFLIELINKLIELLGGNGTIPTPTDPCISPTPTGEVIPIGEPTIDQGVSLEPTTTTAPGETITVAPTSGASTNATMSIITAYGWPDNSPPGAGIAHQELHQVAGGTGTFADPITFATATSAQDLMPPKTIVYVPLYKKYFIMEDDCAGCVRMQMDIWAGGDGSNDSAVLACEGNLTKENVDVEINAPAGRTVDSAPFVSSSGACHAPN